MANTGNNKGVLKVGVFDKGPTTTTPLVGATVALYPVDSEDWDTMVNQNGDLASWRPYPNDSPIVGSTDAQGYAIFKGLATGSQYFVRYENSPGTIPQPATAGTKLDPALMIYPNIQAKLDPVHIQTSTGQLNNALIPRVGDFYVVQLLSNVDAKLRDTVPVAPLMAVPGQGDDHYSYPITRPGQQRMSAYVSFKRLPHLLSDRADAAAGREDSESFVAGPSAQMQVGLDFTSAERLPTPISGNIGVSLSRTETEPTADMALWTLIRNSSDAMSFTAYQDFIDGLFCGVLGPVPSTELDRFNKAAAEYEKLKHRRALPFTDSEAYRVLKAATEAFVMVNCGVRHGRHNFNSTDDNAYLDRRDLPNQSDLHDVLLNQYLEQVGELRMLPYLAIIRRKLFDISIDIPHGRERDADLCYGIVQNKLTHPCLLELIWSYWHEEGMLVQSMNAITQRFQNVRSPGVSDALANSEIDILRPLNNLIWGHTQDEQHRLTVVRRNYEYDHHYGIRLDGKAVQRFRPADSRSKFLEAFHHLLRLLTSFYRQDDDTTVKADAFPVLNALKEVHLILSQGAHNQFGDLPSTARIEMLMQQWLLARPEFREFLPTRVMVAYPEPWMDRVDAMKRIQNWTDTSVIHFRDLAVFGEQLLLSIRYGAWNEIYEPTPAFNWARFWRPQVQGYIHAYRAATGVDLSIENLDTTADATIPSVLLRQRLAEQMRNVGKPAGL